MKSAYLVILCTIISSISLTAQSNKQLTKELDSYITDAVKLWQPPGLAVTVVKDGEIIFTNSYGVTTIGTNKAIDNNTLFGCMSTTKAFVATGLAMLVDDGKLEWNDKVIDYLPEFQLKDPYITRELNIKDLLTHRSGLGNTDYLWSMMNISSDSALYKMRDVEKTYSLRSDFIYQNLFYLAAGKVIESISGKSWGDFLKERIYNPLGMTNTYATISQISNIENKADAHYEIDGDIVKIEQLSADAIGPAGSMWSSITDIGKWVKFLINEGQVGDNSLIKPETFNELFKPHQIVPPGQFYPTQQITKPNWTTYGLGWFQHDYNGKMVQFHTGSLPGMVAIIGMIPDENVGVYVMGNLDHLELRHAIMYSVFDLFTEGKLSRDWNKELYTLYNPESPEVVKPKQIKNAKPILNESDFIGTYNNKLLGWVNISNNNGSLAFNINNTLKGSLTHWNYDTYQGAFDQKYRGKTPFLFRKNSNGKLDYLELFGERFDLCLN